MDLVAIEAPTPRIAPARETLELFDAALGVVIGKRLKIVADQLIKAFAKGFRALAGASYDLLVYGQRDVHGHMICAHVLCVNTHLAPMENGTILTVDGRALLCYMNFGVRSWTRAGFFLPEEHPFAF
jgi:hypothetical protein